METRGTEEKTRAFQFRSGGLEFTLVLHELFIVMCPHSFLVTDAAALMDAFDCIVGLLFSFSTAGPGRWRIAAADPIEVIINKYDRFRACVMASRT